MSLLTWSEHAPLKNDHFFLSFFFEAVLGFVSLAGKVTIIFEWFTIQFMHLTLAMAPRPLATRQETWPGQTGRDTTADIRWIQVGRALGIAICAPRRYVELVDEGRGAKFMAFFFLSNGERERDGLALAVDCWLICRLLKAIHVWWEKEYRSPSLFFFPV